VDFAEVRSAGFPNVQPRMCNFVCWNRTNGNGVATYDAAWLPLIDLAHRNLPIMYWGCWKSWFHAILGADRSLERSIKIRLLAVNVTNV
jgi:hypothetical protein